MEEKLRQIIEDETLIQEELDALDIASNEREILTLAYRIIAKRKVKKDVMFDIIKFLKEIDGGKQN